MWQSVSFPPGPHSDILLMVEGSRDFFASEILAKRDFLGSMNDGSIFLGCEIHREFFGYWTFHQLNSTIT